MMWTGTKTEFWITMDQYGTATLCGMPEFQSRRNNDGSWGIAVVGAGLASVEQPQPLQLEIWDPEKGHVRALSGGYATMTHDTQDWIGTGRLTLEGSAACEFEDHWGFQGDALRLGRSVRVRGNAGGRIPQRGHASPHEAAVLAPGAVVRTGDDLWRLRSSFGLFDRRTFLLSGRRLHGAHPRGPAAGAFDGRVFCRWHDLSRAESCTERRHDPRPTATACNPAC